MEKYKRHVIAVVVALMIAMPAIAQAQADCSGPKFMQIMMSASSLTICAIFGPGGCMMYAASVIVYNIIIWYNTGC